MLALFPTASLFLAMMGFNELFPLLIWVVAPILTYILIRKRQGKKPGVIWILLMIPFGWLAFLAVMLLGA
jgi:hypothetical protein